MQFHQLHPSLATWMSAVEARLATLFSEELPVVSTAGMAVVGSQGKRLRPVLLTLSAAAFGDVTARVINQAALVELIHTASLVHDDVVDEADSRRGALSARARWGNKFSVLLGDFLLGRVFELATEDGDPALLRLLAPTATEMGRGVILELTDLDIHAEEATYWRVIHGKTSALFAAATHIGALLGGAAPEQQRTMRRLGECFGYAFQLADDLMDLQGSEDETGKPLRVDWQQRRATLPLLYAVHHASPSIVEQLEQLWTRDPMTEDDVLTLRFLVEGAGGFEYGWEKVKEYLAEAYECLQSIPASTAREALQQLCTERFPLPVLPTVR